MHNILRKDQGLEETFMKLGTTYSEIMDMQMDHILKRIMRPKRTIILGERRNEVLGERFTVREYLTPMGKIVEVKTIMEMEYAKSKDTKS